MGGVGGAAVWLAGDATLPPESDLEMPGRLVRLEQPGYETGMSLA
jgi:hypothetical protein